MSKSRFKHTGARLRQLQLQGRSGVRETLTAQVERDRGRPATAEEMRAIEAAVTEISNLPVYGG